MALRSRFLILAAVAALAAPPPASAEIRVGFVTALSGAGSNIGIPYAKGIAAGQAYRSEVGGERIEVIQLDNGADPAAATRNARKLVEDNKVDVLIGTATAVASSAIAVVANELNVPYLAVAPISPSAASTGERWTVAVTQPPALMVKVVMDRLKRDGVRKVGYIGFSDAWGDLVYTGAKAAEAKGDVDVVANERYARTDTSVTGQVLKLLGASPDAVLIGGAGTQGALPLLTLQTRNYKGKLYGTQALLNPDFVRVGGKAAENILISGSPGVVAEQLPDGHYAKAIALDFRRAYEKANGAAPNDGFSATAFDAWLLMCHVAEQALAKAKPGTPQFRAAFREGLFATKEVPTTGGLFTFTPASAYGVDERALVLVRLVDGRWRYEP